MMKVLVKGPIHMTAELEQKVRERLAMLNKRRSAGQVDAYTFAVAETELRWFLIEAGLEP